MNKTYIVIIVIGTILGSVLFYYTHPDAFKELRRNISEPIIFSRREMMDNLWFSYKNAYLEQDTFRALDTQQNNITTSEGQSYSMLRAVWVDDKESFDQSWKWTKDNLRQKNAKLFSWLFGEREDGTYSIITERGGQNAAIDADIDISTALIFAYSRWSDPQYLTEAKEIMADIWEKAVLSINGRLVLLANDLEKTTNKVDLILNPSYFSPYAYRIFAQVDSTRPWLQLATDTYPLLNEITTHPLDTGYSVSLPPNWAQINRLSGEISATGSVATNSRFGYDALRTPWRIGLDWIWFETTEAKEYLQKLDFLKQEWDQKSLVYAEYTHSGQVYGEYETMAMYGGILPYFITVHPDTARTIYTQKIEKRYDADTSSWSPALSYYDDNWAWFGAAVYNGVAINLASGINFESK